MADAETASLRRPRRLAGARSGLDVDAMRNEDFLSYKVSVLSRIMDRRVDRTTTRGLGLPLTSMRILGYLHAHQEGRVLAIARAMHMLGSQVSKGVFDLTEGGYVSRSPDPNDARAAIFRLTRKGRVAFEEVFARALRKQHEVATLIGEENYQLLTNCIDILIEHYGQSPTDPPTARRGDAASARSSRKPM